MAASGPGALPPIYTPSAAPGATLSAAGHDTSLHENDRLELRALWTKLGLTPSAGNLQDWMLVGDGTGKSIWVPAAAVATNLVINGSMEIDQRMGPYTTTGSRNNDGSYTLDRWVVLSDGNNVVDVAQEGPTSGFIRAGSRGHLKATVVTANKKFGFVTHLERAVARAIIGGTASLQYAVRTFSSNPLSNCREAILSWAGTADAPTKDVVSTTNWNAAGSNPTFATSYTLENTPVNRALSDTWTEYNADNVAIDTASTSNVALFIWVDDTTTTVGDVLYLTDVRCVPGPKALPMLYRDPSLEKLAARRYCYVSKADGAADNFAMGAAFSTTQARAIFQLPVDLRASPSFSVSAVGDLQTTTNAFGTVAVSAASLYNWHGDKATVTLTSGSLTGGDITMLLAVNSSAWIMFDSELGV